MWISRLREKLVGLQTPSWQATAVVVTLIVCMTYIATGWLKPEPRYRYEKLSASGRQHLYRVDTKTGEVERIIGAGETPKTPVESSGWMTNAWTFISSKEVLAGLLLTGFLLALFGMLWCIRDSEAPPLAGKKKLAAALFCFGLPVVLGMIVTTIWVRNPRFFRSSQNNDQWWKEDAVLVKESDQQQRLRKLGDQFRDWETTDISQWEQNKATWSGP